MSDFGQIGTVVAVSIVLAAWVVILARRGSLSMRYTVGWLFVVGCLIVGSVFTGSINPISSLFGVEPIIVILGAATLGLLAITVQLSITASGLIEVSRTLTESVAILEERVARVENNAVPSLQLDLPQTERTNEPVKQDAV